MRDGLLRALEILKASPMPRAYRRRLDKAMATITKEAQEAAPPAPRPVKKAAKKKAAPRTQSR